MDNLQVYNAVRKVPQEAQKTITGGRLNGKTDINPMWRIKELTNQFGVCGVGWKAPIKRMWLEPGANEEVAAFCEIELFIKVDGVWSDGITGIGGSAFIAKEAKGLFTSDECYKMAYTDAISVSCKMLGFGADIYWDKDKTKYDVKDTPKETPKNFFCEECQKQITATAKSTPAQVAEKTKERTGKAICSDCFVKWQDNEKKKLTDIANGDA